MLKEHNNLPTIYMKNYRWILFYDPKVKYEGPMKLFCYNTSDISIAINQLQREGTNIEIDKHFLKEKLDGSLIVKTHIPT